VNINATLIGQAIAFAVFVWFCMKFVWPPLTAALAERQKKIAEGLNAADKAQRDLESAHAQVADELKAAKAQAAVLIEQANKRANQMVEEAKATGAAEGQRQIAQARAQIEQEIAAARDSLRSQVAALAVAGAEKILEAQVDAKAHAGMLDKLAAEL
jgi:F-type H+-transporting ATPase subunit b